MWVRLLMTMTLVMHTFLWSVGERGNIEMCGGEGRHSLLYETPACEESNSSS